jgi:hypothetical protein
LPAWTTQLREQQPQDAFGVVYRLGQTHLVFVGAVHENQTDSATFRMINDAYVGFKIDSVIAEGYPKSRGPNPPRLLEYASEESRDGFQEGGETVPTVLGALREGARVWGGDPDDADLKVRLIAEGFQPEDVLGYYVLRVLPQWMREQRAENPEDPRLRQLVDDELVRARGALQLDRSVLPSFDEWANWYQALNGKPLSAEFSMEEVGPLQDGSFPSNRIGAAVSRARDAFLHELIIDQLRSGQTVLVVFGGSHLMIQRPALDAALGDPCYAGQRLEDAPTRCQ